MFNKFFEFFIGGEIPVDQRRTFTRVLFRGFVLVHIAWACGWLATIGLRYPLTTIG